MDSVSKKAYQREWAEQNKSKSKTPVLAYVFYLLIWGACIATFLNGFNPELLPNWLQNLSYGILVLLNLSLAAMVVICGLTTVGFYQILNDLVQKVHQKDSLPDNDAKEVYSNHREYIANRFLSKLTNNFRFCLTIAQIFLLYGGQAYFTGTFFFLATLYFLTLKSIDKYNVQKALDGFCTPENVQWLESKVDVIEEFEVNQKKMPTRLIAYRKK